MDMIHIHTGKHTHKLIVKIKNKKLKWQNFCGMHFSAQLTAMRQERLEGGQEPRVPGEEQ